MDDVGFCFMVNLYCCGLAGMVLHHVTSSSMKCGTNEMSDDHVWKAYCMPCSNAPCAMGECAFLQSHLFQNGPSCTADRMS